MSEKSYQLKKGVRPSEAKAFVEASAEELRLLLVLTEAEDGLPLSALAIAAALSPEEATEAISFWRGAGLVKIAGAAKKSADAPKDEPASQKKKPVLQDERVPSYSIGHIADVTKEEALASFFSACEQIHGKELNETDISILLWMHEELALECEYILILLAYCEANGRKPLRYTQKVAHSLFDKDIVTVRDLTAYIERKNKMRSREASLRAMFGIGERKLTAKEEDCFLRWCSEYNYGDDIIGYAYDITVNATGKAAVAYADKIISDWNAAGCKTIADAERLVEEKRQARGAKGKGKTPSAAAKEESLAMQSFDVDDFFAHALERSYTPVGDKEKQDTKK